MFVCYHQHAVNLFLGQQVVRPWKINWLFTRNHQIPPLSQQRKVIFILWCKNTNYDVLKEVILSASVSPYGEWGKKAKCHFPWEVVPETPHLFFLPTHPTLRCVQSTLFTPSLPMLHPVEKWRNLCQQLRTVLNLPHPTWKCVGG